MTEEFEVVRGSGNVFADFGDSDAAAKQLKAQVAAAIIGALDDARLTLRQGAKLAGIDASDLQRIRQADLSRFTLDRLIRVAGRLDRRVELTVVPTPARRGRPAMSAGASQPAR